MWSWHDNSIPSVGNVVIVNGLKSAQFPSQPHQCGVHKTLQTQRKVSSFAGCLKKCTTKQSVNLVFTQCHKLLVWGGGKLGGWGWSDVEMCWFCFLLKWHLVFPFSYHSKFKVFHLLDLNWKRSIKRYVIYYQLGLIHLKVTFCQWLHLSAKTSTL